MNVTRAESYCRGAGQAPTRAPSSREIVREGPRSRSTIADRVHTAWRLWHDRGVFEYDFVRRPARNGYQELVHERAHEGWRLVQVLVEQPAVIVADYVLIFERPAPGAHHSG